jgi:hypothetical protein
MLSPPAATNTLLLITFFLQKYKIVKIHIVGIKSLKIRNSNINFAGTGTDKDYVKIWDWRD